MLQLLPFDLCLKKPVVMSLYYHGENGQEKWMKHWFDWHKFQMHFITVSDLSLLESLVSYTECPAFEFWAEVEHPVVESARHDAAGSRQAAQKAFPVSAKGAGRYLRGDKRPRRSDYVKKENTFCNTSEKFRLASEAEIPVRVCPCSRHWAARQPQPCHPLAGQSRSHLEAARP